MSCRSKIWNAVLYPNLQYGPNRKEINDLYGKTSIYADDICKSLLKFAAKVARNEYSVQYSPEVINDVRKEFELNGRTFECGEDFDPSKKLPVNMYDLLFNSNKFQFLKKKSPKVKKLPDKQKTISVECVFCKNNNEPIEFVRTHQVRHPTTGTVTCPILRTFKCPICGDTGDQAHTIKYCPQKPIITMKDIEMAEHYNRMQQHQQLTWC